MNTLDKIRYQAKTQEVEFFLCNNLYIENTRQSPPFMWVNTLATYLLGR